MIPGKKTEEYVKLCYEPAGMIEYSSSFLYNKSSDLLADFMAQLPAKNVRVG